MFLQCMNFRMVPRIFWPKPVIKAVEKSAIFIALMVRSMLFLPFLHICFSAWLLDSCYPKYHSHGMITLRSVLASIISSIVKIYFACMQSPVSLKSLPIVANDLWIIALISILFKIMYLIEIFTDSCKRCSLDRLQDRDKTYERIQSLMLLPKPFDWNENVVALASICIWYVLAPLHCF